jgi:Putative beta-barrel porin-2, OmpL-like. bbp2
MTLSSGTSFKRRWCLTAAAIGGTALAFGQDGPSVATLEKENQELKARLDALEQLVKKEGLMPSGPSVPNTVKTMSEMTISGFVQASYFHDFSEPPGGTSPGYLWNRKNDSFSLNKVKLTVASPAVQPSGDKWEAGYRVSLMFGQDAPILNSGSKNIGFDVVREAYVEVNAPIGTGLDIKAGELISLLNYESGDGGAANDNFSQGYQWFFTGNGPAAGVQLGYNFTDWLSLKARAQNGLYAGPIDNNQSKTALISLGINPATNLWFSVVGFGGREDAGFAQSLWGASVLGGWQATERLHFGTELDYFSFHNPTGGGNPPGNSPVWSTGLWTSYQLAKQVSAALRAEFMSDKDGVDASGGALGFPNPSGTGQDLTSVAFTINYWPTPNIKFQPEVRFDHSTYATAFGTRENRVIVGAGINYLF